MADLPQEFLQRFSQLEERVQSLGQENAQLRSQNEFLAQNLSKGKGKGGAEAAGPPPGLQHNNSIDTRMIGKPRNFSGKDEDWVHFSTVIKAYASAINPALSGLMKMAESPASVKNEDLDPAAERWSMQLFYILAMLLEGRAQDKVRVAGDGEGAHLWQLLILEHEPKTAARRTVVFQQVLAFTWSSDVLRSIDAFDILVKKYETVSGNVVADETKHGILVNGLSAVQDGGA